ncbi:ATP-grasp domain-containing protein [Stackebrandtia albiflava]|nr:ATP-grasp domain-containing protein [Stackebrandtia albiflava]
MPNVVLYCADPLRPRAVDSHFAAEARRARELGGTVALVDHDALTRGDATAAVARVPKDTGPVWYRGWMVSAERYAALDAALRERGTRLATTPAMYRTAHELPGWYEVLASVTPESAWFAMEPGARPSTADVMAVAATLPPGAAVVKDHVKSRKHEPDAFHIADLAAAGDVHAVVTRFAERQGTDLAGGIVLRAWEPFRGAESRVWWVDGVPVATGPHPDADGDPEPPALDALRELVPRLDCRFVTTDVVRHADGRTRLVELGDGQVSDHPRDRDPTPLLTALLAA